MAAQALPDGSKSSVHSPYPVLEEALNVGALVRHCPKRLRYTFTSMLDQKDAHTCVPLCVADLLDWFVHQARKPNQKASDHGHATTRSAVEQLCCSASMVYDMRRSVSEQGMKCSEALRAVHRYGCWSPSDYAKFVTQQPAAASLLERRDRLKELTVLRHQQGASSALPSTVRIDDYYRVASLAGVKLALARFGPCLLVTPYYNTSSTFWRPSARQYIRYLLRRQQRHHNKTSAAPAGSNNNNTMDWHTQIDQLERRPALLPRPKRFHCVIVCGYDHRKGLCLKNSWGTRWSTEQGYCWFPFADFGKYATEVWVFSDVCER